jgi:tyrosyl-tRNA synthetase
MNAAKQVEVIRSRAVDLHSEEELRHKLKTSADAGQPLRIKYGADPSAPDLHLGHVVVMSKLREFQDLGHTVVFIIGDFTGMIGDPSGRSQTRPALSREAVELNAKSYQEQVFRILDPDRTEVRFNSEWCGSLHFEDVLRLAGRVTVAQLLARDDFGKRYSENQPISLVEFMYPLIQAYDSVVIEADVELGGSDQLFNLLLGRELQKSYGQEPQIVLTLPLLEGLDGTQKMSKSLNNYIGVTEPPQEMFGKAMSVSDDLMWKYFALVLCSSTEQISALKALHPREAKDRLSRALVTRFHGAEQAEAASVEFARVFSEGELPSKMPEVKIRADQLEEGRIGILTLITAAGLAPSNSEARRLVQQGAVRLDDVKITDPKTYLELPPISILRCGKRGFARILCG